MFPHWKKQKPRQRPAHAAGRRLHIERCEDRLMLSGDDLVVTGTIDLFDDSLTDTTNGGFFYRLDQVSEVGLDFDADSLNGAQWHLLPDGQSLTGIPLTQSTGLYSTRGELAISQGHTNSSTSAFNSLDADASIGLADAGSDYLRDDSLREFLPKRGITRFPFVTPMMVEQESVTEGVISLAGLFDANQRTHDTELLAIRSALLASHLDQPTPTETDDAQPTAHVVLQEAESDSTWGRAWSFELASFSPRKPLANPNVTPENSSVPESVTNRTREESPVSFLPSEDSLSYRFDKSEAISPLKESAKFAGIHAEALAELDQVALSSSAWGLAADRRGGLAVTAIALLAVQRVWNATSSFVSEEKEEPQRNNGTTKKLNHEGHKGHEEV